MSRNDIIIQGIPLSQIDPMKIKNIADDYNQNGFAISSTLLSESEKATVIDEVTRIQAWPETPFKWMRYYEPHRVTGERILCRIENFIPYSSVLSSYLEGPLATVVGHLFDDPSGGPFGSYLYKDKINFKLSGASGFSPHQDSPAFPSFSTTKRSMHITALIAIDPMTIENGCLEIAVNRKEIWQQKQGLPHTIKGSIIDSVVQELQWEPVLLNPGDVVFFGSYIPHRSGPNHTETSRRALYITYNAAPEGSKHEQYYQDKRRAFPPECERIPGINYMEGAKTYNFGNPIYD